MIPGLNKKQLEKAMKQMGVKQESIEAEQVIIKTRDKKLIIENPEVVKINMMGSESIQVTGNIREEDIEKFTKDDVKTVMEEAGCTEKEAIKALEETEDIAEAIIKLKRS